MSWCIGLSVELPSSMPVVGDGLPLLNMTVPTKEVTLWLGVNHNLLMHISIHIAIFNKHLQLKNGTRTYHGDSIFLAVFQHCQVAGDDIGCTASLHFWQHHEAQTSAWSRINLPIITNRWLIITYNYHPWIINMWAGLWLRLSRDISST